MHNEDWETGHLVVTSYCWQLNAAAAYPQLKVVASNGYQAIAHDRQRRRSRPWPRTGVILRSCVRSAYRMPRTNVSSGIVI